MRTKKTAEEKSKPNGKAEETSAPVAAPEETRGADGFERQSFAIFMNDKGAIDWDRMQDRTRVKLREVLKNPELARGLGITPPIETIPIFPPGIIGSLYDTLGKVEAAIATKAIGLTPEQALQIFAYSEVEKQQLVPLTSKVLSKYASAWMIKYQDELALGMMILTITVQKVAYAKEMSVHPNGPQAVTEMPAKQPN